MATLTQLRTRITAKIGLDNSVAGDQGLIDDWINEAYEDVLNRSHCKVASQTVTPGATADYALATTVMQVLKMYTTSSGQDYELTRLGVDELIDKRRGNASAPTRYYALAGNLVLWYPTPAAADTFSMYYVARPTALSSGSDTPADIPAEYHKLLEWYALAEAADYDDDQTSAQGQRYRDLYEQGLLRFTGYLRKKGGSEASRFRIGRRSPVRPTVPSQDVY